MKICSPSSSKMCISPLECEEGVFFYSLEEVGCFMYFRKHHMQPPPRALNTPLEKGGTKRSWGGAPTPWMRPHPGPAHLPSPCSRGLLAGPRWLPRRYSGPKLKFGWAYLLFCSNMPYGKCISMYFHVCACKTYKYQNSWRMLVIKPYSRFW
jgi:hypothetical protein